MHILYRITYLPHLENNTNPKYYIGSKYNYNGKYFGSPSATSKDWFTGELSICDWWKNETKEYPEKFKFEIIESYDDITTTDLVNKEYDLHCKLNIKDKQYFNRSYATKGWISSERDENTKKLISDKIKKYWKNNPDAIERKQKLIKFNKDTKSEFMKQMWNEGKFKNRDNWGRPKGCLDKKIRKEKVQRKIIIDDEIYDNAIIAAEKFGIDPVNVRRRCRLEKYKNWRYV